VGLAIKQQRQREQRPCLTFNKMPAFIRQVVNDARQNKPAIKVHPQDSNADPHTAEIINGLIRNIETTSDADVAYDTAIEHAVGQGFGFWRINTAYTTDDAFDQDIVIERISNPFTVYGDPRSTAADSSDWNEAFHRHHDDEGRVRARISRRREDRLGERLQGAARAGSMAITSRSPNIGRARRSRADRRAVRWHGSEPGGYEARRGTELRA
jgi:hypothetical protein